MSSLYPNQYEIHQIPMDRLIPIDNLTITASTGTLYESSLLLPLIVCDLSGTGIYTIIDGYKRYVLFKDRNVTSASCVIVNASSLIDAGKLRIELNCIRPIPFIEKYLFLKWAKSHCSDTDYQTITERLCVSGKDLRDYEQLFESSSEIIDAVANRALDSTLTGELQFLSHEDVAAIVTLFSMFTFTRQMQRELLEWLPELVYRIKKTIPELLAIEYVKDIIEDRKMNDPQKIKKIRDYFYELRFPTLSESKKEWQVLASAANPSPSKVSFNPSEAFEKNALEIKIRINDAAEARTLFKKMADISEETWESLIYPALLFRAKQEKKR